MSILPMKFLQDKIHDYSYFPPPPACRQILIECHMAKILSYSFLSSNDRFSNFVDATTNGISMEYILIF